MSKWDHYSNSLHIYCRLRDFRVPKKIAKFVSIIWKIIISCPKKRSGISQKKR